MMKALFGELHDGRIARLRYLGYLILAGVLVAFLGTALAFVIAVFAKFTGYQNRQALTHIMDHPEVVSLVVVLLVVVPMMFAGFNLQAKRWRDIGLPGLTTTAIMILIGALLRLVGWEQIDLGFSLLILVALLFTPTDALAGRGAKT